ncbi:ubiquitin domain-containing protein Dsk2p [Trichomonascus vanleenenianus]|uniref:ubiquitin domain-containing protein DSK2 n=1 Tax=Trichomonascus vanleenenianus TaxID=2268995 RepID=UPI003ECB0384
MSAEFKVVIKSSSDKKFEVAVTEEMLVSELKAKIEEVAEVPKDRQRLIYSGRVLKDGETVGSYKIKEGQALHLVKGAAPPGSQPSSSSATGGTAGSGTTTGPSQPSVPTNLAAGQGSGNILADLTGARYAGLANLPSSNMFGPDGGMGPMPSPDDLVSMLEQPGVAEMMRNAWSNPQVIDMMINSNPNLRAMGPQVRQYMQSEQFRNLMTNPQHLRQILEMQRMFGGGGAGGLGGPQTNASFPAPGTTESATSNTSNTDGSSNAAAANPFAALLNPSGTNANTNSSTNAAAGDTPANPFAALLGGANGGGFPPMDPALLASLWGGAAAQQQPEDTRPPEERYATQLAQLNELGFHDFDRNVRALRRSGGNVEGAVEALLDGQV